MFSGQSSEEHVVAVMIPIGGKEDGGWIDLAGRVLAHQFGEAYASLGGGRWIDSDTGELVEGPIVALQCYPTELSAVSLSVVYKLAEMLKAALVKDGIAVVVDDDMFSI